jgi:hypothetical protein
MSLKFEIIMAAIWLSGCTYAGNYLGAEQWMH